MLRRRLLFLMLAVLLAGCAGWRPAVPPTASAPSTATAEITSVPATAPPAVDPTAASGVSIALAPGQFGESLAVGASKVWVGTTHGQVEVHDADSGTLRQIIPVAPGAAGSTALGRAQGLAPVKALAYDGQHVWAVVSFESGLDTLATELVILDAHSGQVVQRINASDTLPDHLGLAPGQVWAQYQVFDAAALQASAVDMPTDGTVFAYDGAGWMWAGGRAACDTCPSGLYRFPLADPLSRLAGPAASDPVLRLAAAGGRMWALSGENRLDGYDLAGSLGPDTAPLAQVDLSVLMEAPPVDMLSDGQDLWLLSGAGQGGGALYRMDARTGRLLERILAGETEGEGAARIPVATAFDGQWLWVLTAVDVTRVGR